MPIKVSQEYKAIISPLTGEEFAQLEANVIADGCRDPLVTWDNWLLDGHNRLTICQRHKIPFKTVAIELSSDLEARIWIRTNQCGRRNLSDDQRAMNAAELVELLTQRSKHDKAQKAGETGGRNHPKDVSLATDVSAKLKNRTTRSGEMVAKSSHVSERKVRQAQLVKSGDKKLAEQVVAGQINLASAVREIRKRDNIAALENIETKKAKALVGIYDVIVIDPPWPMEKIERDERPNQSGLDYPTMDENELGKLKIPAAADCHLWLWTTHRFLPMAFRLLEKWGAKYVCAFVWHKPGGFQPIGLPQYNCEFALYARFGAPSFVSTKAFPVCFEAKRGRHSEKPDEFYDLVRRVTAGRRTDMFGRREIEGFDSWGLEAKT